MESLSFEKIMEQGQMGKWYCNLCLFSHIDKNEVLQHYILHCQSSDTRSDNSKWCSICKKEFASVAALQNHLTVHTGLKKYACKYCSKQFGWKKQLRMHENLHTGNGLHQCSECSKPFMSKWLLQRHIKTHERNGPENKRQKRRHQEKVFGSTLDKGVTIVKNSDVTSTNLVFRCHQCFTCFQSNEDLALHLLSHNRIKQGQVLSGNQETTDLSVENSVTEIILTESTPNNELHETPQRIAFEDSYQEVSLEKEESGIDDIKLPLIITSNNRSVVLKNTLTSIVTKLHEQQKTDEDDDDLKQAMSINKSNVDFPMSPVLHLQQDFHLDMQQADDEVLRVKSTDPFISGLAGHEWLAPIINGSVKKPDDISSKSNAVDFLSNFESAERSNKAISSNSVSVEKSNYEGIPSDFESAGKSNAVGLLSNFESVEKRNVVGISNNSIPTTSNVLSPLNTNYITLTNVVSSPTPAVNRVQPFTQLTSQKLHENTNAARPLLSSIPIKGRLFTDSVQSTSQHLHSSAITSTNVTRSPMSQIPNFINKNQTDIASHHFQKNGSVSLNNIRPINLCNVNNNDKTQMCSESTLQSTTVDGNVGSANICIPPLCGTTQNQLLCKQTEELQLLRNELQQTKVYYEKQFQTLNNKLDSMTNLMASQNLLLHKILLNNGGVCGGVEGGGKMSVNGVLDFLIQPAK